jgi:hypothetical protein
VYIFQIISLRGKEVKLLSGNKFVFCGKSRGITQEQKSSKVWNWTFPFFALDIVYKFQLICLSGKELKLLSGSKICIYQQIKGPYARTEKVVRSEIELSLSLSLTVFINSSWFA